MTPVSIDLHHHILPPTYMSLVGGRLGPQGLFGTPPAWSPQISVDTMDRHGIGVAVTSVSAPGVWFEDQNESDHLARLCNDYAAEMVRDHPSRFGFFATLPLPGIDSAIREICYAFDTLNADGVVLFTNYSGCYLGDPKFRPIFAELDRRHAVVFIHPSHANYPNPLPHIPVPSLEFPFETTRAFVSLLYSGVLAQNRSIRFILSHAGGTVPFLAERIARLTARPELQRAVPEGVIEEIRHLFFDTALSANFLALEPLRRIAPLSHIVFGSDYPHAGEATLSATLEGLSKIGLKESEVAAVKRANALNLFSRLGEAR
jgi:aminocarboxymuconate-semialdehyde decarboxylase